MSDIKLDTSTHDIEIVDGELSLVTGLESIAQNLKQRLLVFYGEWFLDNSLGIPYLQHIFVKNPNAAVVDAAFKREVIETPGILEIEKFSLDLDTTTRILTLDLQAKTDLGELVFSEEFGV